MAYKFHCELRNFWNFYYVKVACNVQENVFFFQNESRSTCYNYIYFAGICLNCNFYYISGVFLFFFQLFFGS